MITGTIKNTVNLQFLDTKWQQKKADMNAGKQQKEMTADERTIFEFQEQIKKEHESNSHADTYNKLKSGGRLTPEEIKYLEQNDPEALAEYRKAIAEKEAYERELENCRTKDEVSRAKMNRMGTIATQAKAIINDPYIPKGRKVELMNAINNRVCLLNEAHTKFMASLKYEEMSTDAELQKERTEEYSEETKANGFARIYQGGQGMNEMNVTGATGAYAPYQPPKAGRKAYEPKVDSKSADETGVVYEKAEEKKPATYNVNKMSAEDRAALVSQMKQDQANRVAQLTDIVSKMMHGQAGTFAKTDDSMWKFLASGKFTVDPATKAQAEADIAEDGYWGVSQTSQRMFDFACALAGDDPEKMKEMQAAMQKGFEKATKTWGGELPDICKQTIDAANRLFDDYYASKGVEAAE